MNPESVQNLEIQTFDYPLPAEKIAEFPLSERDQSKLLVWNQNQIQDSAFHALASWLPANSVLVVNNTKVIAVRLLFQTKTGASIEVFCLEPEEYSLLKGLHSTQKTIWKCLIGNQKRWKPEESLSLQLGTLELTARRVQSLAGNVEFTWNQPVSFLEVLENMGNIPLPPYIKRKAEEADQQSYQTVYARQAGAVAAPTAGLHFTDAVLESLAARGIRKNEITLHVGAGTFLPVTATKLGEHIMHTEEILVSYQTISELAAADWVTVVGTTSLRTLESLYWLGVQAMETGTFQNSGFEAGQWLPYQWNGKCPPAKEVFQFLLAELEKTGETEIHGKTRLLIAPGYEIRTCDAIITNFHQPQSTLLLLVSAFTKGHWKEIYEHALANSYRFLSYGDSSLLIQKRK